MKPTRNILPVLLVTVLGLALLSQGCTTENRNAGYGYCDASGCYQCDLDDNCWPIPNQKCTSDAQCSGGTCTNIGCVSVCLKDSDCAGGETCTDGYCSPWGFDKVKPYLPPTTCAADADCKTDEFCDTDGSCKAKCTTDEECGPDMVCAACGKCQPKGVPATCGSTQVFCSSSVPCSAGKTCENGRCHFECSVTSDCPVGQVCGGTGLCADDPNPVSPQCALDSDCGDGACINGYCHSSCKTSGDCGQGAVCQVGICQPDYSTGS